MISQGISHTAYDVMREYMITGAELDGKYQIPMMERYTDRPACQILHELCNLAHLIRFCSLFPCIRILLMLIFSCF